MPDSCVSLYLEEMDDMCDLSRGLISIGEERGIQIGEERGEKKAEKEGVMNMIRLQLPESTIFSVFPGLSRDDYHSYRQEALNA